MINSDRTFKLWKYSVSHEMLLLRSLAGTEFSMNLDIIFSGVRYIDIPTTLHGISVDEDVSSNRDGRVVIKSGDVVYCVKSGKHKYCIVGNSCRMYENNNELFDSGF